ncbi:MAG: hypothetical protein Q9203_007606 [Teloschistes exilis]
MDRAYTRSNRVRLAGTRSPHWTLPSDAFAENWEDKRYGVHGEGEDTIQDLEE